MGYKNTWEIHVNALSKYADVKYLPGFPTCKRRQERQGGLTKWVKWGITPEPDLTLTLKPAHPPPNYTAATITTTITATYYCLPITPNLHATTSYPACQLDFIHSFFFFPLSLNQPDTLVCVVAYCIADRNRV